VSLLSCRTLLWLHRESPQMTTSKLFVMASLLTTVLRTMSFTLMAILNYNAYNLMVYNGFSGTDDKSPDGEEVGGGVGGGGGKSSPTTEFFQKASIVLFDLPDFCCTSAYVLLLVVWAEAILEARRHWLSSLSFRRLWLKCYVVFNILLYTIQVSLYSLLFIPSIDQVALTSLIYLTLTTINLALPLLWLCFYLYLSILFSGFPFSSAHAQSRLSSLTRQGSLWTVTRIFWGFIALTSVLQGWITPAASTTPGGIFYCIVLVLVFFFVEILPISVSLQESMLSSLAGQGYRQIEKESCAATSHSNDGRDELEMQNALQNESFQMHLQRIRYPSSHSLQSFGSGHSLQDVVGYDNTPPDAARIGTDEEQENGSFWEDISPYQSHNGIRKEKMRESEVDEDEEGDGEGEGREYIGDYSNDRHNNNLFSKWWRGGM